MYSRISWDTLSVSFTSYHTRQSVYHLHHHNSHLLSLFHSTLKSYLFHKSFHCTFSPLTQLMSQTWWLLTDECCSLLGQEITQPVQWSLFCYPPPSRPTLWNSLPEKLQQPDITFGQFKRSLITLMFS